MHINVILSAASRAAIISLLLFSASVFGDRDHEQGPSPLGHAPIGVMGEHMHKKGEWMISYRFMHMDMSGNRIGTDSISPEQIATTIPNRFFGLPGQPPTQRVVPTEMTMDMHMFGLMYAPGDRITMMLMGNYIEKEMDHISFAGGMGTNRLGSFTTRSSGFGDTSVSALIGLFEQGRHKTHATLGISAPTGSNTERDEILTPMGMRPRPRLPYPMQIGSGSWSSILGLTHNWYANRWSYGAQWRSLIRLNENDEGYTLGDEHRVTGWAAWRIFPRISFSGRLEGFRRGNIDGIDPAIVAPVQTADPDNHKIRRLDFGLGLNFAATDSLSGHRLALEWLRPVYQKLDGPQLETDWTLTLGWQYAF